MADTRDRPVDLRGELDAITDGSRILALLRSMSNALTDSHLAAFARSVAQASRHSFIYRWLTKEPEPEVIVINLRETYTVGPVIAIVDRLVAVSASPWRNSAFKRVTESIIQSAEAAADTKTGRTVAKLLEPPNPPEEEEE